MKKFYKILKILSILAVVGLSILPSDFAYATSAGERELTDREKAAFIVRDEWVTWVNAFTASLSELDKNATSRIYTNMDYYDMQYRFTEKYKKVPEYLDEDGKPTQKLKDLIKEKRKEINGAVAREFLCFTSNANGSKVKYTRSGSPSIDMGFSTDGVSFLPWDGSEKTLNSGESLYVWNKNNTLNNYSDRITFGITGNVSVSGDVMSLTNFSGPSRYSFYNLFENCAGLYNAEDLIIDSVAEQSCDCMFRGCANLTKAPKLTATTLANNCYTGMFRECTSLEKAPELPATKLAPYCYVYMFRGCTGLKEATLPASILTTQCYYGIFMDCSTLNNIKIGYTGSFTNVPSQALMSWADGVASSGTLYYNGTDTTTHGSGAIPTGWTVQSY